ncbi:SIS domain-containing protein [Puniceibacterium sp. IMCC21224]|uniref:KpsF/GutQ family sugar-phosphate isomerase n=1 Tax=Puniceibacterium sp. IMCC21224 TaxID=1618204 RepID=UPI00064DFA06|nr:KpsF/GutQ family sugar-phosphate isomerase [Puniceibacterium sp. IMCC21224]KMK63972.1 KpsF/GutQ family protein [Puniceibacterium sp. IMCC21224]
MPAFAAPLAASDAEGAARDVLTLEAQALTALAEALPGDFSACVDLILGAPGRVIVCGIGKSGHVGRKISATLASTGTPSYFVHAAEASHGDLGMIATGDVCLMLSNSGETSELGDVLAYCTRFAIPIVAISSRDGSTLMRAATLQLLLPPMPEACPIGMAPTTSTTMMLALGDALAVALMKARGFEAVHFRDFHPGGKLGAQMTRVADLMHPGPSLPLVDADMPMSEALLVMSSKGFGIAAVVSEDGALLGIVTDGDLRRNMDHLMSRSAGEIATRNPVTVTPDTLAARALAVMNERKISVLLVVDGDSRPVGVLHIHDCLRAGVA